MEKMEKEKTALQKDAKVTSTTIILLLGSSFHYPSSQLNHIVNGLGLHKQIIHYLLCSWVFINMQFKYFVTVLNHENKNKNIN